MDATPSLNKLIQEVLQGEVEAEQAEFESLDDVIERVADVVLEMLAKNRDSTEPVAPEKDGRDPIGGNRVAVSGDGLPGRGHRRDGDVYLTTTQAATQLGMSRPSLVKLLDAGELRYHKVGRDRRIAMSAVEEYIAQREISSLLFQSESRNKMV